MVHGGENISEGNCESVWKRNKHGRADRCVPSWISVWIQSTIIFQAKIGVFGVFSLKVTDGHMDGHTEKKNMWRKEEEQ